MRNILTYVEQDISKKMVFISGPRQVGKTTLAKEVIKKLGGKYYNWDLAEDRQKILEKNFLNDGLVVLDELHKYDRWKNFIKGIFDKYNETLKMIVTGSARLNIYRKGADSLFGRYFHFHLHPFSIGEVTNPNQIVDPKDILKNSDGEGCKDVSEQLFKFGGFPEPFFAASEKVHNRWSLQRRELLIKEELRDLTNINLLSLVEHLMLILPGKVGSVLSVNSLKEDLQVAYNTVSAWLKVFEELYITFSLKPYTKKIYRSVHKEKKLYLWDWSQIKEEGARFENFVASHLLKAVSVWKDLGFGNFELFFLRDRSRKEVDFCITLDDKPFLLIEAKLSDVQPSETLAFFASRFGVPAVQILKTSGFDKVSHGIRVVSADKWLSMLP